jgi:hypothetical protein
VTSGFAGVQCAQHSDPGVHQEVAAQCRLDKAMNSRLPFRPVLFDVWQLCNVVGSIFQGDELPTAGKRDGSSNGVDRGNALLKQ